MSGSDMSESNPAAGGGASPYPTVQILQAAMAHRESIRRSFESQRAALVEAIAAQRHAVHQAVSNAQRCGGFAQPVCEAAAEQEREPEYAAPAAVQATPQAAAQADPVQAAGGPVATTPTEKLVLALNWLTTPGSSAARIASAQRALATQQFLDALKVMIAEEVASHLPQNPSSGSTAAPREPAAPAAEAAVPVERAGPAVENPETPPAESGQAPAEPPA
jgi:hypothetical protein